MEFIFDYLRYQDNFYGYNQYGLNEFENQYSINPIDLKRELFLKDLVIQGHTLIQ